MRKVFKKILIGAVKPRIGDFRIFIKLPRAKNRTDKRDKLMKHLVVFTPSGKRGSFEAGTPVLEAAQQLGVDLDSVCGGRGICSKCQVTPSFGDFPKHGVTVDQKAVSTWNAIEQRYHEKRG